MKRAPAHPLTPPPPVAIDPPVLSEASSLSARKSSSGLLSRAWQWIRTRQLGRADEGRLQVAETVSLGEKRFVAVVQVDGRHFLLAGGPANIALLAQLDEKEPFANVLKKTMTVAEPPRVQQKQQKSVGQAAPARATPPPQRRTSQTPRKQSVKPPTAKITTTRQPAAKPAPAAARSPLPAVSTFADVLSTAMTPAAKSPAKRVHRRAAPPSLSAGSPSVDPRPHKTDAASQKNVAPSSMAAVAADSAPSHATGEETFEQWLLQAALRQRSRAKGMPPAAGRSGPKPGFTAACNGNEPSHERRQEPGTAVDAIASSVPPPPPTNTLTIEEYA